MSMIVGRDLQAARKKSKVRFLASSRVAELGGTLTLLNVNAISVTPQLKLGGRFQCFEVADQTGPARGRMSGLPRPHIRRPLILVMFCFFPLNLRKYRLLNYRYYIKVLSYL